MPVNSLKKLLLYQYFTLKSYQQASQWKGNERIFCLSLQKTGTTSFGNFFEHFGYPVVRSDMANFRGWNRHWYMGAYNKIFSDPVFRHHQVFEDAPFWAKDFYKNLHQQFPNARFILFTRDPKAWFNSLLAHGNGEILGDKRFHARNYERPDVIENPEFSLKDEGAYYTRFYENRNQDILDYFRPYPANFLHLTLEDADKWKKLATFVNLDIPEDFDIHANKKKLL